MKIKIKDYEYTILEIEDVNDKDIFEKNGSEKNFGLHNNLTSTIKLLKNMSVIQKRRTLMHELAHAFLFVYMSNSAVRNKFDEEDVCQILSTYSEDIIEIANEYFKRQVK